MDIKQRLRDLEKEIAAATGMRADLGEYTTLDGLFGVALNHDDGRPVNDYDKEHSLHTLGLPKNHDGVYCSERVIYIELSTD